MIVLLWIATFDFLGLYITEHECVQFRVLTDMVGVMSDELGVINWAVGAGVI